MTTASDFVQRGYFPRELPPPFSARDLAAVVELAHACCRDLPRGIGRAVSPTTSLGPEVCADLLPFRIRNRFVPLAHLIEKHWELIDSHLTGQSLSLSRPVPAASPSRAVIPVSKLGELPKVKARLRVGHRYVLHADLSQFYGTLYTHSIPWALHTKPVAKANIGGTIGDLIDKAVRDTSQGQTVWHSDRSGHFSRGG